MIEDPAFYALAVPAVVAVGLSKGGFGGTMALMAVPMLSLVLDPVRAAAIMLPILLVMDGVSLWSWRGVYDAETLKRMLPGALAGVAVGWATAAFVSADAVRLLVGGIGLAFVANQLARRKDAAPAGHDRARAGFWGMAAGFTSFIAHAGGPPYQMYALPLRLDPRVFAGTSVVFFAAVNLAKLLPYALLGQLGAANLATSLVLLPLAPLATLAGVWLVKRMEPRLFYRVIYLLVTLACMRLVWDGAGNLLAGS